MRPRIVVVGVDFGETGDQAIRAGLEQLASGVAHGMYVVHVLDVRDAPLPGEIEVEDPDAHTASMVLESTARRISAVALREQLPYHPQLARVEVRKGAVTASLLEAVCEHRADMLIVGSHSRHGIDRLFVGSVAETLVRSAACSVLVARPTEHALREEAGDPNVRVAGCADPALLRELREQAALAQKPWRPADEFANRHAS